MRVLIISMTCGEGHNSIARSLSQQFDKENVENKIIQFFGFNERLVKQENTIFLFACKFFPHIYEFFWNYLRKSSSKRNSLRTKRTLPYLQKNIEEYKPDIIVCTHLYASNLICELRKKNKIDKDIKVATILHDFCLAPYWELSTGVDYIFQPLDNTTEDLLKKGYKQSQIKTFGLPIKDELVKFKSVTIDKDMIDSYREKLNLPSNFIFLIVSGGSGIGNTLKLVKNLRKAKTDSSIIVVNGRNSKTKKQIDKYIKKNQISNIINLGFVTNLQEYMLACDCIISRCGSCTINEIVIFGKPIIIRENMILNEKILRDILVERKCALALKNIKDIRQKANLIVEDKKLYQELSQNVLEFASTNSGDKIAKFLIEEKNKSISN